MEEEIGDSCSSREDAYRILIGNLRGRYNLENIIEVDGSTVSY
jgi:hypothetical protein